MATPDQAEDAAHSPVWPRALLALTIGTGGGWLAYLVGLPLPWMIGAMLATTLAAVAGLPVALWHRLREGFVVVLGVMLGSSFTPAIASQLPGWAVSLLILSVYTVVSGMLGAWFFRRMAGYDRVTSYFSAMPGGLSVMIFVGEAMGGDSRLISLTHAGRLLLVVLVLPFAFQLFMGYDPASRPAAGPDLADLGGMEVALLTASGVLGWAGAQLLRIPAPAVVGPMLLSAAIHLGGVIEAGPPQAVIAAAQIVVGSSLGCRFAGTPITAIARTLMWAAGGTVVLLGSAVASAWVGHLITGLPILELTLAYSPGGLAEMSLVALALGLEAALVATHHIVRIFLVVVFAPLAFRLGRSRLGDKTP
ncbi:AbrB family transcriptional regulator [Rhodovibrio salinarum]|uniref:Ammonia monooxygenase n=1 Tax=Rhodovibrio salinarum TaxID=1087 RepID=A0A934QKF4_9PROT|nr:AbrB family transcriptional regulator [Rhodovibrio salinarum]MBK1698783.1 hypothetical protein [Rhodovibrio salinarum]